MIDRLKVLRRVMRRKQVHHALLTAMVDVIEELRDGDLDGENVVGLDQAMQFRHDLKHLVAGYLVNADADEAAHPPAARLRR